MKGTGNMMDKKWRKGLVYLFKVLYELGVFAAVYFVVKLFAKAVV